MSWTRYSTTTRCDDRGVRRLGYTRAVIGLQLSHTILNAGGYGQEIIELCSMVLELAERQRTVGCRGECDHLLHSMGIGHI